MDARSQQRPPAPKSAGLTNILNNDHHPSAGHNGPSRMRDSGFYSNADASSKRMLTAITLVNLPFR